jgi:cytochrome c
MLIVVLGGCGDQPARPVPAGEQDRDGFAVLVFTRTTGFRHASIDDGVAAIRRLGASHGFAVDATEDPEQVQDAVLRRYRAIVFLSTTGEPLGPAQQAALQRWVEAGGGWIGVHAAADAFYDFRTNPRGRVHVHATVDESTYQGGDMGDDHPVIWSQEQGRGRAWYTALGHTEASWSEQRFLAHILGGIRWVAGAS